MFALALALSLADPTPLTSKIEDVTLYASTALVHRTCAVPGGGNFVLRGLPNALDPNNVRVRCSGGDVISVEVRDRVQEAVPNERLQALRERLKALRRDLKVAEDDLGVQTALADHLAHIAKLSEMQQTRDLQDSKPNTSAWESSYEFLAAKLAANVKAQRDANAVVEERKLAVQEAERELGKMTSTNGVTVHDVIVEVQAQGKAALDVEYIVKNTGWRPFYDLRTSRDLAHVELGYRAKVQQQTGEDWNDVALALSTAQPQHGAQGPDPVAVWLSIYQPRADSGLVSAETQERRASAPRSEPARKLGKVAYADKDAFEVAAEAPPPPFATVESEGLSVRFQLAKHETIESREQPTTVLVGSATLDVTAERTCAPALDTTVWLRGRAKNTSAWTLLPGQAAVFLGADYLGLANIETVQPGQELTLHLGADPLVTATRTKTDDLAKGPGFLGSKSSKIEGWRVRLENHGTPSSAKDGSVDVIVRDVLPRPRDERISVELSKSEPKPSTDERWKKDAEEKGIQTWIIRVPTNAPADLVYQTTIAFPKGAEIVRD